MEAAQSGRLAHPLNDLMRLPHPSRFSKGGFSTEAFDPSHSPKARLIPLQPSGTLFIHQHRSAFVARVPEKPAPNPVLGFEYFEKEISAARGSEQRPSMKIT
jgi:hypothetical protein